jgi:chaperone modulatory protein CbpM
MKLEVTDVVWLDERTECSMADLADRSRLPEKILRELIDCGALGRGNYADNQRTFDGAALNAARTAARLHQDFELDAGGVALALTLLQRIGELENELRLRRITSISAHG